MTVETEFLREQDVLVSSARIQIDGQTFATRNVGSVKVTEPGRPIGALLLLIVALAMCASGGTATIIGAVLAIGAGFKVVEAFRTRTLVLVTNGGETVALESTNAAYVERVRAAVVQAIATR